MKQPLLYKFQLQDVRKVERLNGRCLVAWDMGLGKTPLSLTYLYRNPDQRPVVVVSPPGNVLGWKREAKEHYGWNAFIAEGLTPPSPAPHKPYPLVVVGYDSLAQRQRKDKAPLPGWLTWLIALQPKLVVIDEGHLISNMATARYRAVKRLCRGVPHVLVLTGTPVTNRPADIFPVANILWPHEFPSFWAFAKAHCAPKKVPWGMGWEFKGASNLPVLHAQLKRLGMLRRTKEETLKDLPPIQRIVVPLPLTAPEEYRLAENDFIRWLRVRNPSRLTRAEKAERLVQMGYLKRLSAMLKLPHALDWAENYLQSCDDKIILFGLQTKLVWAIKDRFKKACVVVDGSVTKAKREAAYDHFSTNKRCRILAGQIRAAGVAWSRSGIRDTAFLEFPWKPTDLTQAEDRTRGINRGVKGLGSSAYYLTADGTIEQWLLEINQSKFQVASAVVDGGAGAERFNVFDLLMAKLLQRRR